MVAREHLVVGVSRTPAGAGALRWALETAGARGWDVVAVHSFDLDVRSDVTLERDPDEESRASARRAEAWVQEIVGEDDGACGLTFTACSGPAERVLAHESVGATLVVMGAPTLPEHDNLPARLRQRCHCPVIVVDEHGAAMPDSSPQRLSR